MNHYLVDTNVVLDMLLDRDDADAACAVFVTVLTQEEFMSLI